MPKACLLKISILSGDKDIPRRETWRRAFTRREGKKTLTRNLFHYRLISLCPQPWLTHLSIPPQRSTRSMKTWTELAVIKSTLESKSSGQAKGRTG